MVLYYPGKKMYLADTLSRVFINGLSWEYEHEDDVRESEFVSVSERRLLELRSTTMEDRCMQLLQKVILEGWIEDLDPDVRSYFNFRNEITVQDGLIFGGNCIVVPTSQRPVLKEKLHSSYLGIEGCHRRAREWL